MDEHPSPVFDQQPEESVEGHYAVRIDRVARALEYVMRKMNAHHIGVTFGNGFVLLNINVLAPQHIIQLVAHERFAVKNNGAAVLMLQKAAYVRPAGDIDIMQPFFDAAKISLWF